MQDNLLTLVVFALLLIAGQQPRPEGWRGVWCSVLETLISFGLVWTLLTRL